MPSTDTVTVDREVIIQTLVELEALEEIIVRFTGGADTPLSLRLIDASAKLYRAAFGEVTWDANDRPSDPKPEIDLRGLAVAREWYEQWALSTAGEQVTA